LHEPYDTTDTTGDLRIAAERLRELLRRIARRAPGRAVDLIAHSQGGLVARIYLESLHESWDPRLPVVDHLVTFATPHEGAPLAGVPGGLIEDTVTGGVLMRWMSEHARGGGTLPDPLAVAVGQQAPGSPLLQALSREDVAYGTRVLALGTANDLVVPADRTGLDGELSRVLDPLAADGHSGITGFGAVAAAYSFLRDAHPPCPTGWDVWGPRAGAAVGWVEGRLPWMYGKVEAGVAGVAVRRAWRVLRRKG
jgi:hypothetical protein